MNFEHLRYRLTIVEQSTQRGRAALITATVASVATAVAAWNAYLSAYRGFPLGLKTFAAIEPTKEAQVELIKQWVQSQWISLGPLGIRIGVGDAAIVAGLGLYIISVWLFFAVRRENRAIAHLLHDVEPELDDEMHRLVHHGVSSAMLFISIADDDKPIVDINSLDDHGPSRAVLLRGSVKLLFYLPAIAIIFTFLLDMLSLFVLRAPFRVSHAPLFVGVDLDSGTKWQFAVMSLAEVLVAALTTYVCRQIVAFEDATTDLIRQHLHDHYPRVRHGRPRPATSPKRKSVLKKG